MEFSGMSLFLIIAGLGGVYLAKKGLKLLDADEKREQQKTEEDTREQS